MFGLVFTFMGGLNSVIWSDLVQVVLYVGAALVVAWTLWANLPMDTGTAIATLIDGPDGQNKLMVINPTFDLSAPWSLFAVLTGVMLMNLAANGLDQDITQRLLACKDAKQGARSLYLSVWMSLPVILLFLVIGSLLYLHYNGGAAGSFRGEKVTVFMHYILTEIPPGLRGLVTVGVIAAAAINSGLISMSAVLVNDLYRPFAAQHRSEGHFVRMGRIASVVLGLALLGMALLSYHWQRYADFGAARFRAGGDGLRLFGPAGGIRRGAVHPARQFGQRDRSLHRRICDSAGVPAIHHRCTGASHCDEGHRLSVATGAGHCRRRCRLCRRISQTTGQLTMLKAEFSANKQARQFDMG